MSLIEDKYSKAVIGLDESVIQDFNKWYSFVTEMPVEEQIVYTVSLLDWQVKNGGFHQYFLNSYGIFAFLTLRNLEIIDMVKLRDILEDAINLVNYEKLNEEELKIKIYKKQIKKISEFDDVLFEQLNKLDEEYYTISDKQLEESLLKYLKRETKK